MIENTERAPDKESPCISAAGREHDPLGEFPVQPILLALLFAGVVLIRIVAPGDLATGDQLLQVDYISDIIYNGQWLVQHASSGAIATKPPLYNWLAAIPIGISGRMGELWFKLPSVVASLLTLFLLLAIGSRLADRRTGTLAGALLLLCPMFTKESYFARTDMLLTLTITAQYWAAVRNHQEPERIRWRITFWASAAAAMLTKGPIGILLPALGLTAWFWLAGGISQGWKTLGWKTGLPLSMLPFCAWFAAAFASNGRPFVDALIVNETLDRLLLNGSKSHEVRHVFYYLPHLLIRAAPTSLFALATLISTRSKDLRQSMSPRVLAFAISWLVPGLIFLSLIPSKRVDRLLPILPAVALLAGAGLAHALWNREEGTASLTRHTLRIWLGITALAGALIALSPFLPVLLRIVPGRTGTPPALIAAGLTILLLGLGGTIFANRYPKLSALSGLLAFLAATFAYQLGIVLSAGVA